MRPRHTPRIIASIAAALALALGSAATAAEFQAPPVPDGWAYHHDVVVGQEGDYTLKLDIVAPVADPGAPLPVVVYIHGGGWNHGSKDEHAKHLASIARRGYVAVAFAYRLAPAYHFPAQIEDVQAQIRYLKAHAADYHLDPARINLWGTSAGAHLASLAGAAANDAHYPTNGLWEGQDNSVFAVVDFSGPNSDFLTDAGNKSRSLTWFLGGRSQEVPDVARDAMPATHADAGDPPVFVAHGDADKIVPVEWSRDYVKAIQSAGGRVEYHEYPGAPHGVTPTNPEAADLAWEFLQHQNFPQHPAGEATSAK